jgi:hypothetical protein
MDLYLRAIQDTSNIKEGITMETATHTISPFEGDTFVIGDLFHWEHDHERRFVIRQNVY